MLKRKKPWQIYEYIQTIKATFEIFFIFFITHNKITFLKTKIFHYIIDAVFMQSKAETLQIIYQCNIIIRTIKTNGECYVTA